MKKQSSTQVSMPEPEPIRRKPLWLDLEGGGVLEFHAAKLELRIWISSVGTFAAWLLADGRSLGLATVGVA